MGLAGRTGTGGWLARAGVNWRLNTPGAFSKGSDQAVTGARRRGLGLEPGMGTWLALKLAEAGGQCRLDDDREGGGVFKIGENAAQLVGSVYVFVWVEAVCVGLCVGTGVGAA